MPAFVEKPDDVLRYDIKVFALAEGGNENAEGTIPVSVYGELRDSEFRTRHKELENLFRQIRMMDLEKRHRDRGRHAYAAEGIRFHSGSQPHEKMDL